MKTTGFTSQSIEALGIGEPLSLTAGQSRSKALALARELTARGHVDSGDLALVLFHAANSSTNGRVDVEVQQAIREMVVRCDLSIEQIDQVRSSFFEPYLADQSLDEIKAAQITLEAQPAGLNTIAAAKLLALTSSQRQFTDDERLALKQLIAAVSSDEVRGPVQRAVIDAIIPELRRLRTDAPRATSMMQDAFELAPAAESFAGVQEAYFASNNQKIVDEGFKKMAADQPDATSTELEVARRLASYDHGQVSHRAIQKLTARIEANNVVSAEERLFLSNLPDEHLAHNKLADVEALGLLGEDALLRLGDVNLESSEALKQFSTLTRLAAHARDIATAINAGPVSLSVESQHQLIDRWIQAMEGEPNLAKLSDFQTQAIALMTKLLPIAALAKVPNTGYPMLAPVGVAVAVDAPVAEALRFNDTIVNAVAGFETPSQLIQTDLDGKILKTASIDLKSPDPKDFSLAAHQGKLIAARANKPVVVDLETVSVERELPSVPSDQLPTRIWSDGKTLKAAGGDSLYVFDDVAQSWTAKSLGPEVNVGALPVVADDGKGRVVVFSAQKGDPVYVVEPDGTIREIASPSETVLVKSATIVSDRLLAAEGQAYWSIDLSKPETEWTQAWGVSAQFDFDRENILSHEGDNTRGVVRMDVDALAQRDAASAEADRTQLIDLSTQVLSSYEGKAQLSQTEVAELIDVMSTLADKNWLTGELADRTDTLFLTKPVDAATAPLLRTQWFGAGLSRIKTATLEIWTAEKAQAAVPFAAADVKLLGAAVHALEQPASLLKRLLESDRVAADDALLLRNELILALERQVENAVHQPRIDKTQLQSILDVASELRVSSQDNATRIDTQIQKLLALGQVERGAATLVGTYLQQWKVASTENEGFLVQNWLERDGSYIDTEDLRKIVALTDADGERSSGEQKALAQLSQRRLTDPAQQNVTLIRDRSTKPEEIIGSEGPPSQKVNNSGPYVVWSEENRTRSNGEFVWVGITRPVVEGADGLHADQIHVSGQSIVDDAKNRQPYGGHATGTGDDFDQVQLLWSADALLDKLRSIGLDVDRLLKHQVNDGKVRMLANSMTAKNAFYSSTNNHTQFGTDGGLWHLASDHDIVVHELGHQVLDHLNPNMFRSANGRAIHEAFGDALASLMFDNPRMGEDWNEGEPGQGLRNVDNEKRISDTAEEEHDRGEVFGGFVWSVKKELERALGDSRRAADLMIGVLTTSALFYDRSELTTADFVYAMESAADAYLALRVDGRTLSMVKKAMFDQGVKRELIAPEWQAPAQLSAQPFGPEAVDLGPAAASALDATMIASQLSKRTARTDVRFVAGTHHQVGDVKKLSAQALAIDVSTGKNYLVDDGHVTTTWEQGKLVAAGGSGLSLPERFDFAPLSIDHSGARALAYDFAASALEKESLSQKFKNYVRENIDRVLAPENVRYEDVIYRGARAIKVISEAADFIVERNSEISVSRVASVE